MSRFENLPESPYAERRPDSTLLEEIVALKTLDVSESDTVGYTLLNRDLRDQEPPIVAIGGFMSDLTTAGRAWEGLHLASLERPILMLDILGHGLSSAHRPGQIYDLCIRRSLESQAEPLTEAVQALLPESDRLDYFGISHGGLLALKIAEQHPESTAGTVFGVDIPGVKKRWSLGLLAGYLYADNFKGRRACLAELAGTTAYEEFETFKEQFPAPGVGRAPSFIRNNPGLFCLNLFASVGARPVGLKAWRTIMEEKDTNVKVATSELGKVSDSQAIEDFIESLDEGHRRRSRQTIIEGEDHNIGLIHLMPRLLRWAEDAYRQKPGRTSG